MRPWYQRYPSIVIAIVLALVLGGWYGVGMYQDAQIIKQPLKLIPPSRVTFLGLSQRSGYRIIIANDQPYVIEQGELESKFGDPESGTSNKKRVPLDSLLRALTGDGKGLGELLAALSDTYTDNSDKNFVQTKLTLPVQYKVLGEMKTVNAELSLPLAEDSEAFKDPEYRKRWEQQQANNLVPKALPLLNNAEVILTEKHITEAWYNKSEAPSLIEELYELHFNLTEDGRHRLLQETSRHLGEQIIIIADDIAVAAPIIRDRMNVSRIDIPNVKSLDLIKHLMDTLKATGVKVSES